MHVRLREIWIWGRTLSPRKLWNAVLLTASYYVARLLRRPIHWGQPASTGFEAIILGAITRFQVAWGVEDGFVQDPKLYLSLGHAF